MPFVGTQNGEYVLPVEVQSDEIVSCPGCGGPMGVRESHTNGNQFISRHFYHIQNGSDSGTRRSGGGEGDEENGCAESSVHQRMKTKAYTNLKKLYPDANVELERPIGTRYADVCVTFPNSRHPYGDGIVVEAQHKNKGKNIGAVSREYFEHGYSVFWAYQSDFDGHKMEIADDRFWKLWPDGVPQQYKWNSPEKHLETLLSELRPVSVETEIPFPLEFYWKAAETTQEQQERQEKRENTSGKTYGKVWLHGKGSNLSWFTVHRTATDDVQLRLWEKSKGQRADDPFSVILDDCAVPQLRSMISDAQTELQQSDAYKSRDNWHTIATAWLTDNDTEQSTWLSFAKPPNSRIQITLGRKTPHSETEKAMVTRRKGDEHRLEDLIEPVEDAFADIS